MTSISFTSGELLDIIDLLEAKEYELYNEEKPQVSVYYAKLADQFQLIYDKLKDIQPENRVANLVLAVN